MFTWHNTFPIKSERPISFLKVVGHNGGAQQKKGVDDHVIELASLAYSASNKYL